MPAQLLSTAALAAATSAALVAAGCSFSYNLASMTGKDEVSPRPPAASPGSPVTSGGGGSSDAGNPAAGDGMPAEGDLVYARIAVAEALSKNMSTQSASWENPATGARGTITPINTAYQQENGGICRDFLASHVHNGDETWLEGAACRGLDGRWTVKRLTPWKQA